MQDKKNDGLLLFIYDIGEMFFFIMCALLLIMVFFFRQVTVDGHSMENTLQDKDRLIVWSCNYAPKQGDIITISHGAFLDEQLIKRVIATEGQRIKIDYDKNEVSVDGKILEVPVGTGVLSMPVFKTLPNADITCLDYSEKMMESAQKRAKDMQIKNISFMQGDVGSLPFEDEAFDAVVSLNGFHAFPDKKAAFSETFRVLKKGGIFCGCFYVKEANRHTDKMIRRFYIKSGFFTPPFETVESLRERLERMYGSVSVSNVQSIAYFRCVK